MIEMMIFKSIQKNTFFSVNSASKSDKIDKNLKITHKSDKNN